MPIVAGLLALLWQILSGTGFPNQFFCDSWVVGFWRGRPWVAWDWKKELGRFLKPKLIRDFQVKRLGGLHVEYPRRKHSYTTAMRPG